MTGSLKQRSEGSWSIIISLGKDPVTGKKKQHWSTFRGNKKQAQAELTKLINELNTGAYIQPSKLTVADYLDRWLNDYAKSNVSGKTFERYAEILRLQIIPAMGSHPLAKLQPLHIQSYYSQALLNGRRDGKGGLSPQTVLHHHRVLREALSRAVKWQLLIRNPADAVEPPRPARNEMHAIDETGTAWLLEVARGTRLYLPVLLAVTTGMRRGEFLAIRWSDINLQTGSAAVRRSIEQTNETIKFKSPKGRKGRAIALLPITVDALKMHRHFQDTHKQLLGTAYAADEDLVCAREDGSIWNPDTFTADFAKLARKAGLKIRLHDLRHSHATQLLGQGIHPKIVSERLGHSTVGITLDIYSHVLPGMQEDAALKMDNVLHRAIQKRQQIKPV
jgi:integrase